MRKIEPWLLQAWGRGENILPLFSKKTPARCQKYERIWRLMKLRSYLKRYPGKAIEMARSRNTHLQGTQKAATGDGSQKRNRNHRPEGEVAPCVHWGQVYPGTATEETAESSLLV